MWASLPLSAPFGSERIKTTFPVFAILEDSALNPPIPDWREKVFDCDELDVLPARWKSALSEWRGIYYILDTYDGKAYVGSAYSEDNLLGRWLN